MYDPAIELLGIYLHELKTYIYKKKKILQVVIVPLSTYVKA